MFCMASCLRSPSSSMPLRDGRCSSLKWSSQSRLSASSRSKSSSLPLVVDDQFARSGVGAVRRRARLVRASSVGWPSRRLVSFSSRTGFSCSSCWMRSCRCHDGQLQDLHRLDHARGQDHALVHPLAHVACPVRMSASVDVSLRQSAPRQPAAAGRVSTCQNGPPAVQGVGQHLAVGEFRAPTRKANRVPTASPSRPVPASRFETYRAVPSPSSVGLVARMTSCTPPCRTRRDQGVDGQLLRPHVVQRGQPAAEDVVRARDSCRPAPGRSGRAAARPRRSAGRRAAGRSRSSTGRLRSG